MANPSNISRRRLAALADGSEEYKSKRTKIISSAAPVFRENGFEAARLADIAKSAGLDRATLYYYFSSKDELLGEAVGSVTDQNLVFLETLIRDHPELAALEKLELFTERVMLSYDENFPYPFVYIQELMYQIANSKSPWAAEIVAKNHLLEKGVMQLLRDGIAAGEFRPDLPVRIAASALFGMLNWTHRWYEPGQKYGAGEVAKSFMTIFLDGMRTQPPPVAGNGKRSRQEKRAAQLAKPAA